MSDDESLREELERFLDQNLPQIRMHGGTAAIPEIDMGEGIVTIRLGGTCTGCGLAPMTSNALKRQITSEFEEISEVQVVGVDPDMSIHQ